MGGERADLPTELPRRSLKRTWREFRDDALLDWAAALTYYGVLALFPALLVLVSILGLLGEGATQMLLDNLAALAPGPAPEIVTSAIESLQSNRTAAGVAFFVGLAGALWSASGYVGAFMRASNRVWDVEEGRPIWKTLPLRVGVTLAAMALLSLPGFRWRCTSRSSRRRRRTRSASASASCAPAPPRGVSRSCRRATRRPDAEAQPPERRTVTGPVRLTHSRSPGCHAGKPMLRLRRRMPPASSTVTSWSCP